MSGKTLVIARLDEPLEWTELAKGWEPFVVQKEKDLPNEGREASSYFWAFSKLYDTLSDDDVLACVQGDPFGNGYFGARENIIPDLQTVTEFTPIGSWHCYCDGDGAPYHFGLPVREKYEHWFNRPFPGAVSFTAGGQFLVTGREIKQHSQGYYREMIKEMSEGENPYVMERLWRYLFETNLRHSLDRSQDTPQSRSLS